MPSRWLGFVNLENIILLALTDQDQACLVEDPATKRHRPRNYLETLEQRVAFLEGVLKDYRPDLANDHLVQEDHRRQEGQTDPAVFNSAADQPYGLSVSSTLTPPNNDCETDENDAINDLASKAGLLSLNAAGAEPHYLGPSSTFAFSRLINASLRQVTSKSPRRPNVSNQSGPEPSEMLAPCPLPEYKVAVKLSNAYFSNIHSQYPFLHEPTFRAWELSLTDGLKNFETTLSDTTPLFFLNMVSEHWNPTMKLRF